MLTPEIKNIKENQEEVTNINEEKLENLFPRLDLSGLDYWDQDLQKRAKDLIATFSHLFVLDNCDFGKTCIQPQH